MIKLESSFIGTGEVKGFNFNLLKKNEYAFIYEVKSSSSNKWYEVFERRISKESDSVIGGVPIHFEEHEIYPKSASFGVWAWCIKNKKDAVNKFLEISEKKERNIKT